jgi:hypothetical protein
MVVRLATELSTAGCRVRTAVAKVGHQTGNFGNVSTERISIRGCFLKIISQRREPATRAYNGAVLEVKKEIPV